MAKQAVAPPKITRYDLEHGIRSLQDGVRAQIDEKKNSLLTAAAIGGVVIVMLVFLIGRRSGKRRTTVVEIRRV